MKKKKGSKSADEFMAELEAKPDYQRRMAEKAKRREDREAAYAALEAPILADLRALGFETESLYALDKHHHPLPPPLVQLLLNWIAKSTDPRVLEPMIRQLADRRLSFDGRILAKVFDESKDENLRWLIINTITCAKLHSIDDWLQRVLQNPYYAKMIHELGGK